MLSIRSLIDLVGNPLRAQTVLLQHYVAKQQSRHHWDRRYAAMTFVLRWAPVFRRHALNELRRFEFRVPGFEVGKRWRDVN